MRRLALAPRDGWQGKLEALGFLWHTAGGQPYWREDACYAFALAEVDAIAAASEELCRLLLAAGDYVVEHRRYADFGIPEWCWPLVERAWEEEPPALNHGRFDLGIGHDGAIKLFEFNCDTPTSLVEAAIVQWFWRQEVFPGHDQFNGIHEALVARWRALAPALPGSRVHFAHIADAVGEDTLTTAYMMDTAIEAGLAASRLTMAEIGWKDGPEGGFFDTRAERIAALWKLYPWEWLVAEPFGRNLARDPAMTLWLEPIWKMLWSNKAILPVLWRLFPGHPNLLPARETPPPGGVWVRKPILGREGANVAVLRGGTVLAQNGGPYDGPAVYQSFLEMPAYDGHYPVIGSWVVDGTAAGIGVREGGLITANGDRFVPHIIEG